MNSETNDLSDAGDDTTGQMTCKLFIDRLRDEAQRDLNRYGGGAPVCVSAQEMLILLDAVEREERGRDDTNAARDQFIRVNLAKPEDYQAIEAILVAARQLIADLAQRGLRCDLTPTVLFGGGELKMYEWFAGYLREADQRLRQRCQDFLAENESCDGRAPCSIDECRWPDCESEEANDATASSLARGSK